MGINQDTFNWFNEQNRRNNIDNYQASFPVIQDFNKQGGNPADPDYQNAIGDYSGGIQYFENTAFGTADAYINEIVVTIVTASDMSYDDYADIAGGLANGVRIAFFQKGEFKFVSPYLQFNYDYQRFFNSPLQQPADIRDGERMYTVSLKTEVPLILKGGSSDVLLVELNDDFSTLLVHKFTAVGWSTNLKEFQGA